MLVITRPVDCFDGTGFAKVLLCSSRKVFCPTIIVTLAGFSSEIE